MLPEILTRLIRAANGDMMTIASLADEVAGGHVKKFFETTQAKLDAATAEDTRDALLEMMKQVGYNATAFQVALEVLQLLHDDVEAVKKIAAEWETRKEPQPDFRDVVVGATIVAPAFASSTGPIRKMYIEALRGSYTPAIFVYGFGEELLNSLIIAKVLPVDIEGLGRLESSSEKLDLSVMTEPPKLPPVDTSMEQRLECFERLAHGGFVTMVQQTQTGVQLFITDRTQATSWGINVRITPKGRRLLTMIRAGRGE